MKKIIVPVDFSEHSDYAMEVAASLAKVYNAEILALHMLEISDTLVSASAVRDYSENLFFMKMAKKRFEEFLDKEYLKGVQVTDIVQYHKVFSEVNETAIKHDADLIVMGSHGASGVKEFLIGSNAEKVVRHAEIPVLIIKKRIPDFSIKKVLFASDFDINGVSGFIKAQLFFKKMDVETKLLYVNTPYDDFKNTDEINTKITYFLNKAGEDPGRIKDVDIRNDYTIERGILNYGNQEKVDLIVIPTHGRKGISHFFAGSIGEDVANHAKIPVMTFKI
ncbi:universal stress protein [Flavobacteriaceae bacterium R38]|nr:universal stress protein [Flavobacteriaceae bacterium R38]